MQDPALFFRQRALACFHRRGRWTFLSPAWRHEVEDAKRFIAAFRQMWEGRTSKDGEAVFTRSALVLGPNASQRVNLEHATDPPEQTWLLSFYPTVSPRSGVSPLALITVDHGHPR